jgi:hypothetical protein
MTGSQFSVDSDQEERSFGLLASVRQEAAGFQFSMISSKL